MIEFVFDTTRAVTNLIYSGTLSAIPTSVHPFPCGRNDSVYRLASRAGSRMPLNERRGGHRYLKRLYYDTAMSATPHALSSLRELVDPSHILFGSDFPFLPEP